MEGNIVIVKNKKVKDMSIGIGIGVVLGIITGITIEKSLRKKKIIYES